jgi:hypothetical protein
MAESANRTTLLPSNITDSVGGIRGIYAANNDFIKDLCMFLMVVATNGASVARSELIVHVTHADAPH